MNNIFLDRKFIASAVGSLSFKDVNSACDFVFETFKNDILFWPQLPKLSFYENMYVQYSQGIPGIVINEDKKKIHIDNSTEKFLQDLEETYAACEGNNIDHFAIDEKFSLGFYPMLDRLKKLKDLRIVKGQVIGPVSFALSVTDQNQQPVIYNPDIFETITKVLAMKAKWQIKKFKELSPKIKTIIFIDEPYLVSIGSSFVSLSREQVVLSINAVVAAVHEEGGLAGVHCCGNTDWSMVLSTDIDILSFDAYSYSDNLFLYKDSLKSFIEREGIIAWGIVPTSQDIAKEEFDAEELSKKIISLYEDKNLSAKSNIITPSCGCGSIGSDEFTRRVHSLTVEVAEILSK